MAGAGTAYFRNFKMSLIRRPPHPGKRNLVPLPSESRTQQHISGISEIEWK